MTDFVEVSCLDRIAPGAATVVAGADGPIALFNVDGRVFAVDDSCVRCGSSLAAGALDGNHVSCPGCDWRYDVATGCVNGIPALQIDTFEVRVVDSRVMVATTHTWASHGN
jgi:nitrite reductase/ring-hydroxylating ferredoxin subunit